MATIIKNDEEVAWVLEDTRPRVTIAAESQDDLENHLDVYEIARSNQLLTDLVNPTLSLVLNDGSRDLTVSQAVRHVQRRLVTAQTFRFGTAKFLRTDNGTEQMAVDGRSTSAEDMWDGTGISDSGTENWMHGGSGSESAGSKKTGTNGLDTGVRSLNDLTYFDYGSDRALESSFDSVTFWMKPIAYPPGSQLKAGFLKSGTTTLVGNLVNVVNYVSNYDLNVWHRVTIPLADFGLDGTAGRFGLRYGGAAGQHFYFDVFEMLNSSSDGPFHFRVAAPEDEVWHVDVITLIIAAADSGWNSGNFATITDGLENGLIMRRGNIVTPEVYWAEIMSSNMDLEGKFSESSGSAYGDNELMMTYRLRPRKSTLVVTDADVMEFVVRDDLSTLSNMRSYVQYGVE